MRFTSLILLTASALAVLPSRAKAGVISLGSAGNFAVLAGTSVTNTGATVVSGGNVGAGTSITGFGPGTVTAPFTTITGGSVVSTALGDLSTAYNYAAGLTPTQNLSGQDLGGMTLAPGVYYFSSSASLTGTLTLADGGNPNAQFVFLIASTLTTAAGSSVVSTGSADEDTDVFWQVGSSATIAGDTSFEGNILAETSIGLGVGATMEDGSALALNGSVTLDDNTITSANAISVPEPSTITLALVGGSLLGLGKLRKSWQR